MNYEPPLKTAQSTPTYKSSFTKTKEKMASESKATETTRLTGGNSPPATLYFLPKSRSGSVTTEIELPMCKLLENCVAFVWVRI
jgi:hypothetical protein